ncbi:MULTISPECIES: DUF2782 domain-containing protein [Chitinibacter]|jgi:hypothetical protein|uniref:DUF2782 domain-containing protein n=1 Tax=Chitinibacter TaxID=230666 RepID=UPI0004094BA6|nr:MULTISPECIES: DUF2782 domain-containing protein [Chitinibacter]
MRELRTRLLALLFSTLLASPALAEVVADLPPPMPTEDTPSLAEQAPEVRIIEKADATIAEYRLHGKLYQVKVTPKVGKPYYLIDPTGKGEFMRRDDVGNIAIPTWVLLEF